MTRGTRLRLDKGAVGVLASTGIHAQSLAHDFGIHKPLCFSPKTAQDKLRGISLSVLLVHEDSWPISPETFGEIAPSLDYHKAYIYRVARFSPDHHAAHRSPLVSAPPASKSVS